MGAIIIMAVHDTEENLRTQYTRETLYMLMNTVDFSKHSLIISDNGSCEATHQLYKNMLTNRIGDSKVIYNGENLGTAKAINNGLKLRQPEQYAVKIDNDVIVHTPNWVEYMQDVMERMPQVGVLGLKRVDLMESPYAINTDQRSRLLMVPHERGQRWRVVEECKHVMGTCTMFSPKLLERVGGLYQMDGLYGFDDSLMCVRSQVAGFINCFLHGVDIDHLDPGGTEYTEWKAKYAGEILQKYGAVEAAYKSGVRDVKEEV